MESKDITTNVSNGYQVIDKFITSKGSEYSYLSDGRINRFKLATDERMQNDITVFVPDFEKLMSVAPENLKGTFGDNPRDLKKLLLDYVYASNRTTFIEMKMQGQSGPPNIIILARGHSSI